MNKYQEALNAIEMFVKEKGDPIMNLSRYGYLIDLQELVDKELPIKMIQVKNGECLGYDGIPIPDYYCPECMASIKKVF